MRNKRILRDQAGKPAIAATVGDKLTVPLGGLNVPVYVQESEYQNGGKAVELHVAERCLMPDGEELQPGELVTCISVWLLQTPSLPPGAFYVKGWSENEKIVNALSAQGIIIPCPYAPMIQTGYAVAAPAWLAWGIPAEAQAEMAGIIGLANALGSVLGAMVKAAQDSQEKADGNRCPLCGRNTDDCDCE